MKRYVAESTSSGVEVLVHHSEAPGDATPLNDPPGWTPGHFEWGYEGQGPRRLAYGILADLIADRFGDAFMKEVVAVTSPIEEHRKVVVFQEEQILSWLKEKLNQS